ncbi:MULTISPECIES: YciI family protein [unclassified Leifsonia]|uniref:YciI family protein n=1 Tax=unclassified Leifsonia TaxID=2663824 RepID=UPI000A1981F2|nr:YciI family protein [Leifsonia sp. NCR5]
MKYMMFVVTDSSPDTESDESDVNLWVDELDASGKRVIGEVLEPPAKSTVVRVRDGKRHVTDGPFAETKEWICGFDILECESLDEAIEIAAKHPMARNGQLEIRPFMTWE